MWLKSKSQKKFEKEFYANYLYKELANKTREDGKVQFIKETKELIKSGKYLNAVNNLKILYYEESVGERVDNYYNTQIDPDKINYDFLRNQKLLLDDFTGKYLGFTSINFLNIATAISVGVFTSVFSSAVKQQIVTTNRTINIIINTGYFLILGSILIILLFRIFKKIYKSSKKELFYGLCLEAIEQLFNVRNI